MLRSEFVKTGTVPAISCWRMTTTEYRRHKYNISQQVISALRLAAHDGLYFVKPVNKLSDDEAKANTDIVNRLAKVFNCTEKKVQTAGWELRTGRTWSGLMARNQCVAF